MSVLVATAELLEVVLLVCRTAFKLIDAFFWILQLV